MSVQSNELSASPENFNRQAVPVPPQIIESTLGEMPIPQSERPFDPAAVQPYELPAAQYGGGHVVRATVFAHPGFQTY